MSTTPNEDEFKDMFWKLHYLHAAITVLRNRCFESISSVSCPNHPERGPHSGMYGGPGPTPPDVETTMGSIAWMHEQVQAMSNFYDGKFPCGCPLPVPDKPTKKVCANEN